MAAANFSFMHYFPFLSDCQEEWTTYTLMFIPKSLSCFEISLSLLFFYIQISSFKWPKANPWKLHFIVTSLSQRYLRIPEKCKLQRNGRRHFWILVSKLLCAWCHSSCCASRNLSSTSPFAVHGPLFHILIQTHPWHVTQDRELDELC